MLKMLHLGLRLVAVAFSGVPFLHANADRPNIIVVLTDDQTYRAIGYINPAVLTPNLNALAGSGLIFNKAYVASPICVASRAAILSGVYPQQNAVIATSTDDFDQYRNGGTREGQTLAYQLGQAGYHCAFWGKSHLGDPTTYGFHEGKEFNDPSDDATFREVAAFLTRAATDTSRPFFLWLAPRQPHVPLEPGKEWLKLYDENAIALDGNFKELPPGYGIYDQGVPGEPMYRDSSYTHNWLNLTSGPPRTSETIRLFIKAYYATISRLDDQMGQLISHLKSLGLERNAVIIFLSDNGYLLGNHGLGNKITMHEESVRVPMFLWKDGLPTAGKVSQALVSSLDIYPTLLELAGVQIPDFAQGISLVPLLGNSNKAIRDVVFSECVGVGGKMGEGHRMARTDRWKYVLDMDNGEHLFDEVTDPYELKNLILSPEQPEILERLRAEMFNWMRSVGDRRHPQILTQ
jgi:arylsulfatase A-like enzyme